MRVLANIWRFVTSIWRFVTSIWRFVKSSDGLHLTPALVLLVVLLVGAGLVAFDVVPGGWHPESKNVAVYTAPAGETGGVSVALQPPLATQVADTTQPLLLSIANHTGKSIYLTVPDPQDSTACLSLNPAKSVGSPSADIPESGTSFEFFDLHASKERNCLGEHPLVFSYSWYTPAAAASGANHKVISEKTSPLTKHYAAVSTSVIEIVRPGTRQLRSFFHIAALILSAILLPILLWVLNTFYQSTQRKQEIWKALFPGILLMTQQHYLPLQRRIQMLKDVVDAVIASGSDSQGNVEFGGILEKSLLLRGEYLRMAQTHGGFHFRGKPGEEFCADLFCLLWQRFFPYLEPEYSGRFSRLLAVLLPPDSDIPDFIDIPYHLRRIYSVRKTDLCGYLGSAPLARLEQLSMLLWMLETLLAFEMDRPLWPEWYSEPPQFKFGEFEETTSRLIWATTPHRKNDIDLASYLNIYLKSIPQECRVRRRPS